MTFVVPLSDLGRDDLAVAGGKGANLGELVRAGLPVPDGFVVTTAAYATVISSLKLMINERAAAGEGAAIRADVEAATMPEDIHAAISDAYGALGWGPVAVRSSATAEDLLGAAFAGQQDTYLNVVGQGTVIDAIRRCWASLWTDRAIAYRSRIGIDSEEVKIAVVVQRMINADVAGVMFTADPVSGDRTTIVVDASTGLGEAVVSGVVHLITMCSTTRAASRSISQVITRSSSAALAPVELCMNRATSIMRSGYPTVCLPI